MTNELNLDDLDDLESVYGQSQSVRDVGPGQSQNTAGFNVHANWNGAPQGVSATKLTQETTMNPFDELAQNSSRMSGSSMRVTFADPPATSRKSESMRKEQQAPPLVKPVTALPVQAPKPATTPAVPTSKDPFDELSMPVDLLSAPVPRTVSPPVKASAASDPFADLEPLEPIVPMHCQPTTKIVGISQGTTSSAAVSPVTIQGDRSQGQPKETPGQAKFSMASPFLGEAKTCGSPPAPARSRIPPVAVQQPSLMGGRRAFSPQPNPTVGKGETAPIRSIYSLGAPPPTSVSKSAEVSGKGGWSSPRSDFADIDKMLFQQVETLKTSGVAASGGKGIHQGSLNSLSRRVSMKDARASIGTS